jgi:hypothetical protein
MPRRRKRPDYLKMEEWEHNLTGEELYWLEIKQQEREEWRERAALAKKRITAALEKMRTDAVEAEANKRRATFKVVEQIETGPDFRWLTHCNWPNGPMAKFKFMTRRAP